MTAVSRGVDTPPHCSHFLWIKLNWTGKTKLHLIVFGDQTKTKNCNNQTTMVRGLIPCSIDPIIAEIN